MPTKLSDVFISNTKKLLAHCDKLSQFQKYGRLTPITLDISPTNKCNNTCDFCSVKNRDVSKELTLEQAIYCTNRYIEQGICSIEITGGGEPTMWKHLLNYLPQYYTLPIGLITNGLKLHEFTFNNFWRYLTWLRISLNGMDHDWVPKFTIPKEYTGTISFSYVWHKKSPKDILQRLETLLVKYPIVESLKIQLDVFDSSLEYPNIHHPKVFIVEKDHKKPAEHCYMGWIKPHLDADGYIYHCSTCALRDRKFPMEWQIGRWDKIPTDYPDYFNTDACERCFYVEQNNLLDIIKYPSKHSDFV